MQVIVNTVNCVGVMGKGIAREFKERYPEMYADYRSRCMMHVVRVGEPYIYRSLFDDKSIINFPTKRHWRSPALFRDIEEGLDFFVAHYKEWGVTSVAFPPLGCGNGGLRWENVGPLMYDKLSNLDIEVEVYAPYGTAPEQLATTFLSHKSNPGQNRGSKVSGVITPEMVVILETIYQIQNQRYTNPIGRIMFQKACYLLTHAGLQSKLSFVQLNYGPYSPEVKNLISVFANNNLITETQLGKMMRLEVTQKYLDIRERNRQLIEEHHSLISKVVDLMSRIKNTEQSEEVATIIFANEKVKELKQVSSVSQQEIAEYVFEWKTHWKGDSNKVAEINETIDDLRSLSWV